MVRGRSIRLAGALALAALASFAVAAGTAGSAARPAPPTRSGALALPAGRIQAKIVSHGAAAPTDQQCRDAFSVPCYSPQEIQHAYGLDSLLARGDNGTGQSIVIIDSFGSPTLASDLATFDADYGLQAPPSLSVLAPLGSVPFDPTNDDMVGWAVETTLDVEWAHAMATGASIVVLTSPVSETEGVQGMPEFLALEQYALDHHLGQIFSQSWGATENTLFSPAGQQVFNSFEKLYASAALHHVTVLASSGDGGTANQDANGGIYPFPTVIFPSSSPLVTSVGGTSLYADTSGDYQSETVWNDGDDGGATGGGLSQTFGEPLYQRLLPPATQRLLAGHRGTPDISWNADELTPILVYLGFLGPGQQWLLHDRRHERERAAMGRPGRRPQPADPSANRVPQPLPVPARSHRARTGLPRHHGREQRLNGVPGYPATPGWDLATGWGSPDIGQFFSAIAAMPAQS